MKKSLLIFCFSIIGFWGKTQSFTEKTLQQAVTQLNTAKTANDYDVLLKKFMQTNTSERWQADYYAAVALYLKTDLSLAKKADPSSLRGDNAMAVKSAFASLAQQDNTETQILLGLIHLQRISLGASSNIQKDLSDVSGYISKAEKNSPNSPRLTVLKMKMAEQSSASNSEIEKLRQKALKEFDTYSSSKNSVPTWGKQLVETSK